jgi:hypothetical protein
MILKKENNNIMNVNQKIDEFLKIKRQSLYDLEKAMKGLQDMGVRSFIPGSDGVPEISTSQKLLPRYELTLEDWEWKAIYNDGTELNENGKVKLHFGNIDQNRLEKIMLISNFEIDTSNQEKRLIVTLNFKDGTYDFLNCGSMEVRGKLTTPCLERKKLILFKRNRESFTAGVDAQSKALTPTGEKITYKRYYLGYQLQTKVVLICAYPNGEIGIENS